MSLSPDRTKHTGPESDMTPMVDVTFLLLIFFMVTAAFTMQRAMAVPKPQAESGPTSVSNSLEADIIVEVDEFNTFHLKTDIWEEEALSEHDLVRALRRLKEQDTNENRLKRMLVKANGEALHEKVVAALDSGAYVGISEIKLLTLD